MSFHVLQYRRMITVCRELSLYLATYKCENYYYYYYYYHQHYHHHHHHHHSLKHGDTHLSLKHTVMCSLIHELQMYISFVKYCFPLLLMYVCYITAINLSTFIFQTVCLKNYVNVRM